MPPLPGLVPPDLGQPKPGEGRFTATLPLPHPPGFSPPAPLPDALPGAAAQKPTPTVFYQDRNADLHGGARTCSDRAREAAKAADPAVTQILHDDEWRAHHLINLEGVRSAPVLVLEE